MTAWRRLRCVVNACCTSSSAPIPTRHPPQRHQPHPAPSPRRCRLGPNSLSLHGPRAILHPRRDLVPRRHPPSGNHRAEEWSAWHLGLLLGLDRLCWRCLLRSCSLVSDLNFLAQIPNLQVLKLTNCTVASSTVEGSTFCSRLSLRRWRNGWNSCEATVP